MSPAPPDSLTGTTIAGRYRVVQLLRSGGLGHVYEAAPLGAWRKRRSDPDVRVALKVLRREHRQNPELVRRFMREASVGERVLHPNIRRIVEVVSGEEIPCFIMDLLVGLDLADTLAAEGEGALRPARAARIAYETALGLGAAHAQGIVHGDVKPENLFLVHSDDGRESVKIMDFGAAPLPGEPSREGAVTGTPEYMAPEQAAGARPSTMGDVYSLGVVLYEMLTGRVPLYAAGAGGGAPPPMRAAKPDLDVSEALVRCVDEALAKAPSRRFEHAGQLAAALAEVPETMKR